MKDWKYVLSKLEEYKSLIDFSDQMEKHNFKWVNQFISKNKKKNQDLEGSVLVVETIIEMRKKRIKDIKKYEQLISNKKEVIGIAAPPGYISNQNVSKDLAKYAADHIVDFRS